MRKYYVLDTNVLLHSPQALQSFNEHTVVIPEVVIEELDRFKKESGERGINSREVSRILDRLRCAGDLLRGVVINEQGGLLQLEANHTATTLPLHWERDKCDNRILQICKGLQESGATAILVSQDTNLRVKASILSIAAEDFRCDKVASIDRQYSGRAEVYTASKSIDNFHREDIAVLLPEDLQRYDESAGRLQPVELITNQFLLIRSLDNQQHTALGRFDGEKIVQLRYKNHTPFGVTPRSAGQLFLQECLMLSAQEAPLVIVKGPAGTAKTFYSLAVGLYKQMEVRPREYHHLLICRPNAMLDEGIGFLPGSESEKIEPYMRSIKDNLFTLFSGANPSDERDVEQAEDTVNMLFEKRIIQTEALAYQRGRSLHNYWVMFDEMQNSTPHQAKAVLTRSGLGTKMILLGDPAQIDNPLLDSRSNGLSYAGEKMQGSKLCFQITLLPQECERSPLASEAAARM